MQNGIHLGHRRAVHPQHRRQTGADGETTSDIAATLKAMGVKWLRTIRTTMSAHAPHPARGDEHGRQGAESDRRRRRMPPGAPAPHPPQVAAQLSAARRVVRTRYGVDDEVCTGDTPCIRLSGCVAGRQSPAPIRWFRSVAHVNNGALACGLCGEVAMRRCSPVFLQAEDRSETPPGGIA